MVSAVSDLIALFDSYAGSEGFAQGAAFVVVMMLLGSLIDVPYSIMNLMWQRKISHECNLRCEGQLNIPCCYKACPAHGNCSHYQARTWWVSFKSVFQRKKDGAT